MKEVGQKISTFEDWKRVMFALDVMAKWIEDKS
jgi:hypothetical protein